MLVAVKVRIFVFVTPLWKRNDHSIRVHKYNFTCCSLWVWNLVSRITGTIYEGVSKSFRTESITKYTLTTISSRWEATQRVMAAILVRLTHKMAMQLHLVAESCTICSSRSRRPVLKLWMHPRTLSFREQGAKGNIWVHEGCCGKQYNEELHNVFSSPHIIRVIMSRRMRWVGHGY
jgi:hypothetical protein